MPKFDLVFNPPFLNAAGALGFAPNPRGPVDASRLGAFITNPVSLNPRTPARKSGAWDYPGGFLLHTGYPNPGLKAVLRRYEEQWARSPVPILVHLLAEDAQEIKTMLRRLEGIAGVEGVELSLPPNASADLAAAWTDAVAGEIPVILRLPLDRAAELAEAVAFAVAAEEGALEMPGITALSLGPPRGALPLGDRVQSGRLYGPALFPLVLAALQAVQAAVSDAGAALPVIAGCGVYRPEDAAALLQAGAAAVQLDAVLWRGSIDLAF